ncbi:M16 family metallopeptidase [Streptomyces sp. NBC_00096]|uniref:M16 family metallopeptidase n=1 Tax=Streptomyces sp. NBC_00096 TaxID=2975650 RepID=UPI00324EDDA5
MTTATRPEPEPAAPAARATTTATSTTAAMPAPPAPAKAATTDADATPDADGTVTTTVNGIPALLSPRPGLISAGLLFRVGRADETLATSGITHLVEHLALHRHGSGAPHHAHSPGTSTATPTPVSTAAFTHFQVTGTPADVVEYLNGVCASLRDLPLDRLETEKEILRTEEAANGPGRADGPARRATLWRYGSRSYGLTGYAETGLAQLTAEQVRDWARTRFTAGNAVLWITAGTLPEGLDLTLPSGDRHPAPAATSALPALPAHFPGGDGSVVLTSVLPRSTAASLFAEVLGRELLRELRHKGGYAYGATARYAPRDAGHATVIAHAEALPQHQDATAAAFADVLAKLRDGRIEPSDLEAVRASALARLDAPGLVSDRLPGRAADLLLRHRHHTLAEARAEIGAVTVEALHEVARDLWAGSLLQVPGRGVDRPGLAAAPTGSAEVVSGRAYPAVADPGTVLTLAGDGVSLVTAGSRITVRYAECSLVQAHPDGARHLVGHDGFTLTIDPARFGLAAADLAVLDAAVPPSAVLRMPPRTPARSPVPTSGPPAPATRRDPRFTVLLWILGVPGMVTGGSVLLLGLVMGDEHSRMAPENAWFLLKWLLVAGASLIPWAICLNRRMKGRN